MFSANVIDNASLIQKLASRIRRPGEFSDPDRHQRRLFATIRTQPRRMQARDWEPGDTLPASSLSRERLVTMSATEIIQHFRAAQSAAGSAACLLPFRAALPSSRDGQVTVVTRHR